MIRVLLAVVLAVALLGASLPTAERVERDRNAELAANELEAVDDEAERLAAENDPVAAGERPATTAVEVTPPNPSVTDGGRVVVTADRLAWTPRVGPNRTVEWSVTVRVDQPIRLKEEMRLRLSLLPGDRNRRAERRDRRFVVRVEPIARR